MFRAYTRKGRGVRAAGCRPAGTSSAREATMPLDGEGRDLSAPRPPKRVTPEEPRLMPETSGFTSFGPPASSDGTRAGRTRDGETMHFSDPYLGILAGADLTMREMFLR